MGACRLLLPSFLHYSSTDGSGEAGGSENIMGPPTSSSSNSIAIIDDEYVCDDGVLEFLNYL